MLIFTTGMGHRSIAEAVREAFESSKWEVKLVSFEWETTLQYYPAYKMFPVLNKAAFELTKNDNFEKFFRKVFRKRKLNKLEDIIRKFKPDLVISTYFLYNPPVGQLKEKYAFKLFNYVCNPRTFHPLELSAEADLNLVYDQKAKERAVELGVAAGKVKSVGWLVRSRFYEVKSSGAPRPFTLTVSAGSLGAQKIVKFLPIFERLNRSIRLNLISGSSKVLFNIFKSYKRLNKAIDDFIQSENEVNVYGFTDKIHELVADSDLVAGKAGPNLLFESVAAGKPFLALFHIPGQEDGNLEIIEKKGLGWVAEEPQRARELLNYILETGNTLQEKSPFVEKESLYNQQAAKRLIDLARKNSNYKLL